MKRIAILLIGMTLLLSSCAVHNGLTRNQNNHTTQVVLSQNNYKVLSSVKGSVSTTYIFGIGGISKNALINKARAKMMAETNIEGGAKAIINETVEVKQSLFLFVNKYKVTVSGHIIEFTD